MVATKVRYLRIIGCVVSLIRAVASFRRSPGLTSDSDYRGTPPRGANRAGLALRRAVEITPSVAPGAPVPVAPSDSRSGAFCSTPRRRRAERPSRPWRSWLDWRTTSRANRVRPTPPFFAKTARRLIDEVPRDDAQAFGGSTAQGLKGSAHRFKGKRPGVRALLHQLVGRPRHMLLDFPNQGRAGEPVRRGGNAVRRDDRGGGVRRLGGAHLIGVDAPRT